MDRSQTILDRFDERMEEIMNLLRVQIKQKFGMEYEEILAQQEEECRSQVEEDTTIEAPNFSDSETVAVESKPDEEEGTGFPIIFRESQDSSMEALQKINSEEEEDKQMKEKEAAPRYLSVSEAPSILFNNLTAMSQNASLDVVESGNDVVGDNKLCPGFHTHQSFDKMLQRAVWFCEVGVIGYDVPCYYLANVTRRGITIYNIVSFDPGIEGIMTCTSNDSLCNSVNLTAEIGDKAIQVQCDCFSTPIKLVFGLPAVSEVIPLRKVSSSKIFSYQWPYTLLTSSQSARKIDVTPAQCSRDNGNVVNALVPSEMLDLRNTVVVSFLHEGDTNMLSNISYFGEWGQNKSKSWYLFRVGRMVGESSNWVILFQDHQDSDELGIPYFDTGWNMKELRSEALSRVTHIVCDALSGFHAIDLFLVAIMHCWVTNKSQSIDFLMIRNQVLPWSTHSNIHSHSGVLAINKVPMIKRVRGSLTILTLRIFLKLGCIEFHSFDRVPSSACHSSVARMDISNVQGYVQQHRHRVGKMMTWCYDTGIFTLQIIILDGLYYIHVLHEVKKFQSQGACNMNTLIPSFGISHWDVDKGLKTTSEQQSPVLGMWGSASHNLQIFFSMLEHKVLVYLFSTDSGFNTQSASSLAKAWAQRESIACSLDSEGGKEKILHFSTLYCDTGWGVKGFEHIVSTGIHIVWNTGDNFCDRGLLHHIVNSKFAVSELFLAAYVAKQWEFDGTKEFFPGSIYLSMIEFILRMPMGVALFFKIHYSSATNLRAQCVSGGSLKATQSLLNIKGVTFSSTDVSFKVHLWAFTRDIVGNIGTYIGVYFGTFSPGVCILHGLGSLLSILELTWMLRQIGKGSNQMTYDYIVHGNLQRCQNLSKVLCSPSWFLYLLGFKGGTEDLPHYSRAIAGQFSTCATFKGDADTLDVSTQCLASIIMTILVVMY